MGPAQCSETDDPVLRVVAGDGVWTWFNDERAIVVGDDLYVGYVDAAGYSSVATLRLDGGDVPVKRGARRLALSHAR